MACGQSGDGVEVACWAGENGQGAWRKGVQSAEWPGEKAWEFRVHESKTDSVSACVKQGAVDSTRDCVTLGDCGGDESGCVLWPLVRCGALDLCFLAEWWLLLLQSPDHVWLVGLCFRVPPCDRGILFSSPSHERQCVAWEQWAWV